MRRSDCTAPGTYVYILNTRESKRRMRTRLPGSSIGREENCSAGGGGFGMTPWCDDLVCSWRRLLADRHSPPFPWTLSLHRRWCPSASHHPLTFLFLLALTFPLPSPFPSLGLFLRRPWCPLASPHSFSSLSLGRLCQRSPRTCPVSLLCVESTQRKANAFAVGRVRPSGHPKPAVRYLSPTAAGGPWDGHLRVVSPTGAHNNLSPPSSRAQSILWRAQHKPPTLGIAARGG